jgi:CcmD family protein
MEEFFVNNALYVVLSIALISWVGIFLYLVRLDRRISGLEQERVQ